MNKLQFGVGVEDGRGVDVKVAVEVGVSVTVGVAEGVNVSVGGGVSVGVGGIAVISQPSGVLMERTAPNLSTYPWRKDARWIMEGSIPKTGITINLKL